METSAKRAVYPILQLCICLPVISLLLGFSVHAYQSQNDAACIVQVAEQISSLQGALETFAREQGRYPLPAARSQKSGDGDYSHEVSYAADSRISRIAGANPVLIGAVPYATLGLGNDAASDCWGHKITYVVTEMLTSRAGFANAGSMGGIVLNRGRPGASRPLNGTIAYMLISHGRHGMGASQFHFGQIPKPCYTASDGLLPIDKKTCLAANAVFYTNDYTGQDPAKGSDARFEQLMTYGEKPAAGAIDCESEPVTWGAGCIAPAHLTSAGGSVNVTDLTPPFTGAALSTCLNGVRQTLGICLP